MTAEYNDGSDASQLYLRLADLGPVIYEGTSSESFAGLALNSNVSLEDGLGLHIV
jgi:hypothetical protein